MIVCTSVVEPVSDPFVADSLEVSLLSCVVTAVSPDTLSISIASVAATPVSDDTSALIDDAVVDGV